MKAIHNRIALCVIIIMAPACTYLSQSRVMTPDLVWIENEDGWEILNRGEVAIVQTGESEEIYLNAQPGDGIARLEGSEFINGTIELDIKGRNVQGASFVGVAFRGVDETTYDAVYFRPFNFLAENPVNRGHGVQYISHPTYTWSYLRAEHPEEYENPVDNVPDPNAFFHVKIVVEKPKVEVFVNNADTPCLVVNELTDRTGGWIGLYVGNYSDGTFANLRILSVDE